MIRICCIVIAGVITGWATSSVGAAIGVAMIVFVFSGGVSWSLSEGFQYTDE